MFDNPKFDPWLNWFFYGRVSDEKQKKKETVKSQIEDALRLVPGLKPERILVNEAVGGNSPFLQRDGVDEFWKKIIAEASAGRKPCLLTQFIDRLGRDAEDTIGVYNKLMRHGVRLFSIYEGEFQNTPEGAMKCQIFAAMAQYVRSRILAGSQAGILRTAEANGWTGGPLPFGFLIVGEIVNGKRRNGRLVIDERFREIIRRMFEDRAAGKSCGEIAAWLIAIGVPGRWSGPRVAKILRDPMYKGRWPYRKRHWHEEISDDGTRTKRLIRTEKKVQKENHPDLTKETHPEKKIIWRECPAIVS
jgi:DNA invertase Pin-like site-specific DNA recombinase